MVTAKLTNYRQSPRKVRVVASMVQGKGIAEAIQILTHTTKVASLPLRKLLESALTNAKNANVSPETLFVKEMRVDGGLVMKRSLPKARGSASTLRKRTSHVVVVLGEKAQTAKK